MPNTKPAVALDPAPDPQELLAAKAAGLTLVAWRAAGKPAPQKSLEVRISGGKIGRPYAPYRSKWEQQYAEYLDRLVAVQRVLVWRYEPERLEIGVGAKYTPDFSVLLPGAERVEYREVKGYRREASIVRIKAAALRYPLFRFVLVTKRNGHWHHQPITPLAEVEG